MPRVLATFLAVALAAGAGALRAQQQPFVERVEVSRVVIDVRVVDDRWRPITGLEPPDFGVKIDGKPVRVESAEWIEGASAPSTSASAVGGSTPRPCSGCPERQSKGNAQDPPYVSAPRGRLIVVLVQKSLEPVRIVGLMRMSQLIDTLIATLTPEDRVAVLSFDSHLKIWSDFTSDVRRIRSILVEDVLTKAPPPVSQAAGLSLMSRLDQQSARRLPEMEDALHRLAEALEPLPGAKSVVLLGFGFGRFNQSTGGAFMMPKYDRASEALQRARATVFSLNITQANYNSLQAGLQTVAAETGGFYVSTYEFPKRALEHVVHALAGYYALFVEKPRLESGEHAIEVRLNGKDGRVFARSNYVD